MSAGDLGPVLFAYDGSELAGLAIDGRPASWQADGTPSC